MKLFGYFLTYLFMLFVIAFASCGRSRFVQEFGAKDAAQKGEVRASDGKVHFADRSQRSEHSLNHEKLEPAELPEERAFEQDLAVEKMREQKIRDSRAAEKMRVEQKIRDSRVVEKMKVEQKIRDIYREKAVERKHILDNRIREKRPQDKVVNHCKDRRKNGNETDIDCGGGRCAMCKQGQKCNVNTDCLKSPCVANRCCSPVCKGKRCGASNGCGSICAKGSGCCSPVCKGKRCGASDGCGSTCKRGSGCCQPVCKGAKCGTSDGCGRLCVKGSGCCQPICKGKKCGASDGCGGVCKKGSGCKQSALAYPTRSLRQIKGLQPDFWGNAQEVVNNGVGGVAVNLVWAHWERRVKRPNSKGQCGKNEVKYDNHCFVVQGVDQQIRFYSSKGIPVTGVLYGVPVWARKGKPCYPASPGFDIFCTPNKASDYARFVGMIARRYNGLNGYGRVVDFVIHNEVNSNIWFDIGCGKGKPCNMKKWIKEYADNYNAAYDLVVKEQPHAKVLISLEHHFGKVFDKPSAKNALLSGKTFLKGYAAYAGSRKWRVAFHSYPPDLTKPDFSPNDFPRVTFGNLGVLMGWLRQSFPRTPSSWEVQLTENGISSLPPRSSLQRQAVMLCNAFRNILGTPGIESFIYHRMSDHPAEIKQGLALGLRNPNGSAKPAWSVWANANRKSKPSCGFENIPYTKLTRYYRSGYGHWASTRLPPAGFKAESYWKLFREPKAGTRLLYECRVGKHNIITPALNCENQEMLGPVGYIYTSAKTGTVALYRCRVGKGGDHFISSHPTCEGHNKEMTLGYAFR